MMEERAEWTPGTPALRQSIAWIFFVEGIQVFLIRKLATHAERLLIQCKFTIEELIEEPTKLCIDYRSIDNLQTIKNCSYVFCDDLLSKKNLLS